MKIKKINRRKSPGNSPGNSPVTLGRVLALFLAVDGLLTAILGRSFLANIRRSLPAPARQMAGFFQQWPGSLLRVGALVQALAGAAMFVMASRSK